MASVTARYHSVKPLIRTIAKRFKLRFGGDLDEIIAEANLIFLEYAPLFDKHRMRRDGTSTVPFAQYIAYFIWKRLEYPYRREARRKKKLKRHKLTEPMLGVTDQEFDVYEWAKTLSEEAAFVVKAVVEVPIDLRACLLQRRIKEPGYLFRCALREYLRDLGWSLDEILKSFQEIKESL